MAEITSQAGINQPPISATRSDGAPVAGEDERDHARHEHGSREDHDGRRHQIPRRRVDLVLEASSDLRLEDRDHHDYHQRAVECPEQRPGEGLGSSSSGSRRTMARIYPGG
jgi:hypothetical protein